MNKIAALVQYQININTYPINDKNSLRGEDLSRVEDLEIWIFVEKLRNFYA